MGSLGNDVPESDVRGAALQTPPSIQPQASLMTFFSGLQALLT